MGTCSDPPTSQPATAGHAQALYEQALPPESLTSNSSSGRYVTCPPCPDFRQAVWHKVTGRPVLMIGFGMLEQQLATALLKLTSRPQYHPVEC